MQYLGGKFKLGAEIAAICTHDRKPGESFWDLCCGTANVISNVEGDKRYAVDIVPSLISLLRLDEKQLQTLPTEISLEKYLHLQKHANIVDLDPLLAFVGFGCSFSGKWFAGYARQKGYNFASGARNSLIRKSRKLVGVEFICADWWDLFDQISGVAYIDPPYANTTKYLAAESHDPKQFWHRADALSEKCRVFVSEYEAPPHWKCVKHWCGYKPINKLQRTEKLFSR